MVDAFSLPDLRWKLLFTLAMLVVFRFVAHVPVPGVDRTALADLFQRNAPDHALAQRFHLYAGLDNGLHIDPVHGATV